MHRISLFWIGLVFLVARQSLNAAVVTLNPVKDNTLIQQSDPLLQRSNGQGDIFIGRTNQDGQGPATISIRRGLVEFDVASSIPAGSIITSVTLTMRDVMGLNGDPVVYLHRLLGDWGEGASFQNGGQGDLAKEGDATWLYTFFNVANPTASTAWINPGGDFSSTVSGSATIFDDLGAGQLFSWTSANNSQLLADVQSWLNNPSTNFGWIMIGDESKGQTAKRFNSSESSPQPSLVISYTAIPEASSIAMLGTMGLLGGVWLRVSRSRRMN